MPYLFIPDILLFCVCVCFVYNVMCLAVWLWWTTENDKNVCDLWSSQWL